MKEARVQVKVPLVPRPGMQGSEESTTQDADLDRLAPDKKTGNPLQMAKMHVVIGSKRETLHVKPGKYVTEELREEATEHIHMPLIELDAFRKVKRRRMRTFGRSHRWGRHPGRWQPAAAVSALLVLAICIPVILVWPRAGEQIKPKPTPTETNPSTGLKTPDPVSATPVSYPEPKVRVYLSATGTTLELPLESYVTGVVAAEMPAEFRLEALKAQAIAARTFIVRRMAANDTSGVPSGEADVTDTINHQVFLPPDQVKADWTRLGKAKEWEKLQQAVRESRDAVMTYQGRAITASFFSTSNGYTENAEDVWGNVVPYLKSVASPWDKKLAPGFEETITLKRSEILQKMNLDAIPVSANKNGSWINVLSTTKGHRIKEIQIAGETFSGPEVRKRLGLRSSQFSWKTVGDEVQITTYGYGHGVGMSQWGANGMAQEGHTATEILKHYYTGISFGQASKMLASKQER
ncbi:stage II sporulation protein D [Paenibacillus polysaccharolyticus]|uniref:stage II sporulation protein D n=1 Tax=Paenibacillus polysaccharolyticus TaxID=582692 RepID=UPI00203B1321|nr:stage II sporulation protein D [Paenibacillus polysaccharolyticus]MCM3134907.1 stage II sporulation protein D [Paenibacillus polysaccharolyticus]